jgi:hypothetical protein
LRERLPVRNSARRGASRARFEPHHAKSQAGVHMNTRIAFVAAAIVAAMACGTQAVAQELKLSNKWRIEVSEGANNDGTILFRVTPKDGTPSDVSVAIKKGRSEDGVAKDIKDAFRATLDEKAFHAEVDDGEDVLVKKKGGPDFEVKLVESTVEGTRINIDKE